MSTEPETRAKGKRADASDFQAVMEGQLDSVASPYLHDGTDASGEKQQTGRGRQRGRRAGGASGAADPSPQSRPGAPKKAISDFTALRQTLSNAEAVAKYIRDNHNTQLRNNKDLNKFLQALSQRSDEEVYEPLFSANKSEVVALLERMSEAFLTQHFPLTPAGLEFILRCERYGVRKSAWADGVQPLANCPQALMSPKEFLRKLSEVNPIGKLHRSIELCMTESDIEKCARRVLASELTYKDRFACLAKLVSKARRVLGAALGSPEAGDAENAPQNDEAKEEKEEEKEEKEKAVDDDDVAATSTSASVSASPNKEAVESAASAVLEACKSLLVDRPPGVSQLPIAKLTHFIGWCDSRGVLRKEYETLVDTLEEQVTSGMAAQEAQLEAVLTLKAIPHDDPAAFEAAIDEMWDSAAGRFKLCSPDVLSSIATAAMSMPETTRSNVAAKLRVTGKNVEKLVLPRRALRLMEDEASRVKNDEMKRKRETEEAREAEKEEHDRHTKHHRTE